jgi:hypothetical protein
MDCKESQNGEDNLSSQLSDLTVQETGEKIRQSLLEQCTLLLSELGEFEQYLVTKKKDTGVELRHFKNSVKTELGLLQKVCASDQIVFLLSRCRPFISSYMDMDQHIV